MVESLYSKLYHPTTIARQRVVERFGGDFLDERWTERDISGSSTSGMVDAIDEGFFILNASGGGGNTEIDFNDIRQYDDDNSVIIWECKLVTTTSVNFIIGLAGDLLTTGSYVHMGVQTTPDATNFILVTRDGSSGSNSSTTKAFDSNWHTLKSILTSTSVNYNIDGILEVSKTNNLPAAKLQPMFLMNGVSKEGRVRYMEVYNK